MRSCISVGRPSSRIADEAAGTDIVSRLLAVSVVVCLLDSNKSHTLSNAHHFLVTFRRRVTVLIVVVEAQDEHILMNAEAACQLSIMINDALPVA